MKSETAFEKRELRHEVFCHRRLVGADLLGADLRGARFENTQTVSCNRTEGGAFGRLGTEHS